MTEEMAPFRFNIDDPMHLVLIILTLGAGPAGVYLPKLMLKNNPPIEGLQGKLNAYQTILIYKTSPWNGVALFAIVIFMVTQNPMPIVIAVISMLMIATNFPSIDRINKAVNLNEEELRELRNKSS